MSYGQAFATFLGMTPPEWQVTTTEKEPADEFNWDLIGAIEAGSGGNILAELKDDFSDLFGEPAADAVPAAPAPDIPALFEQLWPLTREQLKQRLAELQLPAETRKALKEFILAKQQKQKQKTFDETKVAEAMARNLEMARQRRPGIAEARQQIRRPASAPAPPPASALTVEEVRQAREQLAKELEEEDRRRMEKRLEEEEAKRAFIRSQRMQEEEAEAPQRRQEEEDKALEREFLAPVPVPLSLPMPTTQPLMRPKSHIWNQNFFNNLPVEDFEAWKEEATLLREARAGTLPFEMAKLSTEEFRAWKAANSNVLRLPPYMQKWPLEKLLTTQQYARNNPQRAPKDMLKFIDYTPAQFLAAQQLGPKKRKAGSSSSSSSRPRH